MLLVIHFHLPLPALLHRIENQSCSQSYQSYSLQSNLILSMHQYYLTAKNLLLFISFQSDDLILLYLQASLLKL